MLILLVARFLTEIRSETLDGIELQIANRHRRGDQRPFLLLTIDLDRVSAPWRYDAAGDDFPHIYGPLNRDAIVDVRPFPRSADGTFLPL